jgi:hypothetical protein
MMEKPLKQKKKGDSVVRCTACNKRKRVSFSLCLRKGWPVCCDQTMYLFSSPTNRQISEAVADAMAPLVALRRVLRPRSRRAL